MLTFFWLSANYNMESLSNERVLLFQDTERVFVQQRACGASLLEGSGKRER